MTMMYEQISFDEYYSYNGSSKFDPPSKFVEFSLRDLECLSFLLISQSNDDINYGSQKNMFSPYNEIDFYIEFWGKNKLNMPSTLLPSNEWQGDYWFPSPLPTYDIVADPGFLLQVPVINSNTGEFIFDVESLDRILNTFPTYVLSCDEHKPLPNATRPINYRVFISKIIDDYFIVQVVEKGNINKYCYFKADQIDGLIDLIEYLFNKINLTTLSK